MAAEVKKEIALEIAHVLFIDIVGYSKLLITEQTELLRKLTAAVTETEQFRNAEAEHKLVRLPTGDGMALVFRSSPEAPLRCAIEISKVVGLALQVRMGIHSGPVNEVTDVNQRINITGAGINIAQRVMDCGDAGHILLSRHVADDLEQYPQWRENLHELGRVEVKHGVKLDVVNFYNDEAGNAELPQKFKQAREQLARADRLILTRRRKRIAIGATLFVAITSGISLWTFFHWSSSRIAVLPISDKSIAVLPFENLSDERENAYFADGVQSEILTALAKIADLKVISRTSVIVYKAGNPRNLREVAQQLGVAQVLEGSVQRAGGKVRVNAQLIDARTDKHLWARSYDRDLADVFAIETEVAQAIANELQAKLSASEKASIEEKPTQDIVAYDLYIRATPLIEGAGHAPYEEKRKDYFQAIELLNQAIARDPAFLLAYCWLARAHDGIYLDDVDHTAGRLALAKLAIASAFRLKPDSGEAHLALALHLYWGYFDYDRARAELAIAQRTLPNNPRVFEFSGLIDRRQGRWSEAVRNLERASELDPRNISFLHVLATTYWLSHLYQQAADVMDRILVLKPNDIETRLGRAEVEIIGRGDTRPLHAAIDKILMDDPAQAENETVRIDRFLLAYFERDSVAAGHALEALREVSPLYDPFLYTHAFWVGVVARMKGDDSAARTTFTVARAEQEAAVRARPDSGPVLSGLGRIDAALGRKEEALSEGRRAVELTPITRSSLEGSDVAANLALTYAWAGERDLAIEQLEIAAKIPNGPHYGDLRLNPMWNPLRNDPRFEKIIASLAPRDAKQ
jgi:TolB-like protein/Flp pilus assembly protein TadD